MENFTTQMINRKVKISFDNPKYVIATFQAQRISFACQGQWFTQMVSIPKSEYTLERMKEKVNKLYNVDFY
jgi:hypothetical protein